MIFENFQEAYTFWLREIFDDPEYSNAPRGFQSRERLGVSFRINDPIQRHVTIPSRRTNLVFNFAESLWYLSGTNDLSQIAYYAPSIRKFSADGRTLAGTAYGPRIFSHGPHGIDQWNQVLQTLRDDPDSKRAVLQIFQPGELQDSSNIDVACTLALQFFIRDGYLHGVTFMRANDAFRGVVSDVFSFTFILELMAKQLGLKVGKYVHNVGSMHVYATDDSWSKKVLADLPTASSDDTRFPELPDGDNWPYIRQVLKVEDLLRRNVRRLEEEQSIVEDLPSYWQQVLMLFEVYRQVKHDGYIESSLVEGLDPVFKSSVLNRWSENVVSMSERSATI